MPRPPFDHFRFVAAIYDRFAGDSADHEADRQALVDLLALPDDGWLLDAGGGTGRVSGGLSSLTGGVVIADASLPMLRQARRQAGADSRSGRRWSACPSRTGTSRAS